MPDTLAQIKQLIGTAACTSTADCCTVAIGARACGGPEYYLPWSTMATDGAALNRLAETHSAQRRAAIKASGEQSTCSIPRDPGAICVSGQCRLGTAGPDPT